MKINALVAAALLACSAASQATVTNWGTHAPVEIGSSIVVPGAFVDFYTFTLSPSLSVLASVVVSNDNVVPNLLSTHISLGSYGLFLDPDASVANGTGLDG